MAKNIFILAQNCLFPLNLGRDFTAHFMPVQFWYRAAVSMPYEAITIALGY